MYGQNSDLQCLKITTLAGKHVEADLELASDLLYSCKIHLPIYILM